ncbi:MAG TPA: DUF1772 domain-containing protein [Pyrinomonadaceae bacterium]|nr:DUF1772 domain-containing protein [Pyrinomonadaceae bacterium]
MKNRLGQVLLFALVFVGGLELGGGIYETVVVVPVWSADLPASLLRWSSSPDRVHAVRFFGVVTPLLMLIALATMIAGWNLAVPQRRWLRWATITFVLTLAGTLLWFVPTIDRLLGPANASMSPQELTRMARLWVQLNWVRAAAITVAWLCALQALRLEGQRPKPPST